VDLLIKSVRFHKTQFVYDKSDRPHFLGEIIDPKERIGVKTEYDDKVRLLYMFNINEEAVELFYNADNSLQTAEDVFGIVTMPAGIV